MKTYIATIDSSTGTQVIQLAAASVKDAQSQIEATTKFNDESSYRYSIQEQSSVQAPNATSALLQASGGMLVSIFALVVAIQFIDRHFKEMTKGKI